MIAILFKRKFSRSLARGFLQRWDDEAKDNLARYGLIQSVFFAIRATPLNLVRLSCSNNNKRKYHDIGIILG